jgi:hypothetical protein
MRLRAEVITSDDVGFKLGSEGMSNHLDTPPVFAVGLMPVEV